MVAKAGQGGWARLDRRRVQGGGKGRIGGSILNFHGALRTTTALFLIVRLPTGVLLHGPRPYAKSKRNSHLSESDW